MGLYLQQKNERSELQQRIAAELNEKAKKKANVNTTKPDGVIDSAYLEKTKTTTSLAWVWILIAIAIIGLVIWLIATSSR